MEKTTKKTKSKRQKSNDLWLKVQSCPNLLILEKDGFMAGAIKGKTMNVSLAILMSGLKKQYDDVWDSYTQYLAKNKHTTPESDIREFKRDLANLRNQGGCIFLKLEELEAL